MQWKWRVGESAILLGRIAKSIECNRNPVGQHNDADVTANSKKPTAPRKERVSFIISTPRMNSTTAHDPEEELFRLREQIDALDEELIQVIAKRFRVTEAVSVLKAVHALNAVDPDREAQQEARLHRLAVQHKVSPEVASRVFRAIVNQVVADHEAVANRLSSGQP